MTAVVTLVTALALVLVGTGPAHAEDLTISAAVSMKDAVEQIGRLFTAARPGTDLHVNLGSSGALQKQIEAGAPVDVFISAAERQMDALQARHLVVAASRRTFARNVLVAIRPTHAGLDLAKPADLLGPGVRHIAMGNPTTVPAGQYAEESLRALGLWERLRPKLVFAEHVRQALDYVARGEVEAGLVYATDAIVRRGEVAEAFRPGEDTYRPIVYPVAIVAGSRHAGLAQAFIDLLAGARGREVLGRFGFEPPARRP